MFNGYGQVPVKHALPRAAGADLSMETRQACLAAVRARQYPNATACYDYVRMGGAVPTVDAPIPASPEEQATSSTRLYVGIGIAVLVVGVGAYLITR